MNKSTFKTLRTWFYWLVVLVPLFIVLASMVCSIPNLVKVAYDNGEIAMVDCIDLFSQSSIWYQAFINMSDIFDTMPSWFCVGSVISDIIQDIEGAALWYPITFYLNWVSCITILYAFSGLLLFIPRYIIKKVC